MRIDEEKRIAELRDRYWRESQEASDILHKGNSVGATSESTKSVSRGGHPRFYQILEEMANLHDRKNTDYSAGGKQGPLGNFIRVSDIKKLYPGFDWDSPFGTAIDYMLKQFDAMMILRATKRESVTGEPISTRLRDMEVYTVIAEIINEEELAAKWMDKHGCEQTPIISSDPNFMFNKNRSSP